MIWNGKMKAITFSYDDGNVSDERLIELFNKYNCKCTFNINSLSVGNGYSVTADRLRQVYNGHEIAVHTLSHPRLYDITDQQLIEEVEQDRINLERYMGYDVRGMAYPFGHCDQRIINVLKENTKIKYSRTTNHTFGFSLPTDLLELNPTIHHLMYDKLMDLGEQFLKLKPKTLQLFYIWGHSWEFDKYNFWNKFEDFLKMICNKEDTYYATNIEVLRHLT